MNSITKKFKKVITRPEFYVFLILIALAFFIEVRSGQFFSNTNIVNILRSMTVPLIYGLCAYLGFISTGPDVSFPLVAALSTYVATGFMTNMGFEMNTLGVFVVAIIAGMILGAINGFIIAKYNFPSLIVTLGTSTIFSGILFGFFEAGRVLLPPSMMGIMDTPLIRVTNPTSGISAVLPTTFIIALVLYFIVYLILNYTIAGRGVFAVGGDPVSAERSGFSVPKTRFWLFVLSGGIAAIAGVIYSLESSYFLPTEFVGEEMIIIAAVVLGGTSMIGGIGTLTGVFLGTMLLTIVSNSLILVGVPIYWQRFIVGAIIIIGTAISVMQLPVRNRKKKEKSEELEMEAE